MKYLIDYFSTNLPILMLITALFFVVFENSILGKKKSKILIYILVAVFALTIFDFIDYSLTGVENETKAIVYTRRVFSFLAYSLRPCIPLGLVLMVVDDKKTIFFLWGVATLNAILHSTSLFGVNLCYTIDLENDFIRGPLGYTSFVISGIYIIVLLVTTFYNLKIKKFGETVVLFICVICCIFSTILESVFEKTNLLNISIIGSCVFYYLFLFNQYSKKDIGTGLFNRQTYFSDVERYDSKVKAIIILDMNGLKTINDNLGHAEGDKAIKAIADSIDSELPSGMTPYRIGGDEFIITCQVKDEYLVKDVISSIKRSLEEKSFSISAGYAIRHNTETIDFLMKTADEMMYSDKKHFYSATIKNDN